MNVVTRKTLNELCEKYSAARGQLEAWYAEASTAKWKTPQDIKDRYSSASFLENNRVCFNIKGNDYRLVVGVSYGFQAVYIKFFGTHTEYDEIDANTVEDF